MRSPPPVIDVRQSRAEELELITRVLTDRSPVQHREWLSRQDQGVFDYLIAWDGTVPVGHVGMSWPDDRRPERDVEWGTRVTVHHLEVVPERRNEGVGRALMLELEERVRERGLADIGLSTGIDDYHAAARHLYRSLGYVELPGTLHIWSVPTPSDRPTGLFLGVVTMWTKTLPA